MYYRCKSQQRLDAIARCALNYGTGEGRGDEKGRRRGDEEREECKPALLCCRKVDFSWQELS